MIETNDEFDNVDWLQAIADHPDLSDEDLLAAYDLLGVKTTLTEQRLYWGRCNLEMYGLLKIEYLEGDLARYTPMMIPDVIVTDDQEVLITVLSSAPGVGIAARRSVDRNEN